MTPPLTSAKLESPLDVQNRTLRAAEHAIDVLEEKLAALLAPILDRAGATAAAEFARKATDHLTAAAPGVTRTSTMIALKPTAEQAAALAVDGGEPAESLHVTLAFVGDVEGDLEPIAEALRPVAASHAPLSGTVGGIGIFAPGPEGLAPAILLPDVPGLVELRVAVTEALTRAGISYSRLHGFCAHMTLDYFDPAGEDAVGFQEPLPLGEPLTFGELLVVRSDTEVVPLPLVGPPPITAAAALWEKLLDEGLVAASEPPSWSAPAGDEIVDVDALVKTLRTKTDPVRKALVEAAMTPTLKQAGLDFDVTNPYTAKVLAQSGSQVTHIAETTRLNVMRIVAASYREGLSIPDTAAAIRAGMSDATPARARLIARTELAGAVNGGSLAATQIVSSATGDAYYKTWLTADGAVNPRHEEYDGLDGQTVALDAMFDVGGTMLEYPGDPGGPPDEICNCRCALVYTETPPGGTAPVAPPSDQGGEEMSMSPPAGDTVSVGPGPFVSPSALEKIEQLGIAAWPPEKSALAEQVFGKTATDTVGLYKTTGEWTAGRQELHDRIVEAHFEGKTKAARTKRAYFTAGGGASGKSHALFRLGGRKVGLDELAARPDTVAIDPDRIKTMLPEYRKLRDAGDPYAASGVHEESSEIAKRIQQQAYDRGLSVLVDTTGSSGSFVSKLEAAKAAGYEVKVSMFSIPTNEAIMRSLARGDRKGRYVAIGALKKAHAGASRQLGIWKDSPALERWQVWDNSGGQPRLIAEAAKGQTTVYDQEAFDAILAKANEQ